MLCTARCLRRKTVGAITCSMRGLYLRLQQFAAAYTHALCGRSCQRIRGSPLDANWCPLPSVALVQVAPVGLQSYPFPVGILQALLCACCRQQSQQPPVADNANSPCAQRLQYLSLQTGCRADVAPGCGTCRNPGRLGSVVVAAVFERLCCSLAVLFGVVGQHCYLRVSQPVSPLDAPAKFMV